MGRRFLIDGYNLLHAVGLPARLGPKTLHHARQRLIALVHRQHPNDDITIVFDAQHAPPGVPRERTEDGIHIIFAHGSADDMIHDIVAHDSSPRSLCVVTSDREVKESARRRNAQVMDAIPFLDQITPPTPPIAVSPEKPTTANDEENRHWLDAFGSIDAEAEILNLQRIEPMNPDPDIVKKHRLRPKLKDDA